MVKLVEEFNIDSEVLTNALVKAGVVDETFVDGNVYRIDCAYGLDGVTNTYTIKVEKEISLKDIKIGDSKELVGTDNVGRPIYKENAVSVTSGVGSLSGTPYTKLIKLHDSEAVLSKEDAERLLNNIDVLDKSANNIINTLNKSKEENETNESLSAQQGIKVDDLAERVYDAISKGLSNTPINVVIDILNNDKDTAENFAKEFIKRASSVKGGF